MTKLEERIADVERRPQHFGVSICGRSLLTAARTSAPYLSGSLAYDPLRFKMPESIELD